MNLNTDEVNEEEMFSKILKSMGIENYEPMALVAIIEYARSE